MTISNFWARAIGFSIGISGLICLYFWGKPGLSASSTEKLASTERFIFVFGVVFAIVFFLKKAWNKLVS